MMTPSNPSKDLGKEKPAGLTINKDLKVSDAKPIYAPAPAPTLATPMAITPDEKPKAFKIDTIKDVRADNYAQYV